MLAGESTCLPRALYAVWKSLSPNPLRVKLRLCLFLAARKCFQRSLWWTYISSIGEGEGRELVGNVNSGQCTRSCRFCSLTYHVASNCFYRIPCQLYCWQMSVGKSQRASGLIVESPALNQLRQYCKIHGQSSLLCPAGAARMTNVTLTQNRFAVKLEHR